VTRAERRLTAAVCIIVGTSLVIGASLTFLITPMLDDLGLSSDEGTTALALPSIGSLAVVFVAGRLGDRIGHRRVILGASVFFIAGSALIAAAQGMPLVTLGLLLAGAAATAIQIVSLGLLQSSFPSGSSRVSAFTTFGMVFPAVYLLVPVLTGWAVGVASWRWVPLAWAILGLFMPIVVLGLIREHEARLPTGEMWTPILGGLVLAGFVQALNSGNDNGWLSPRTLAIVAATIAMMTLTALLLRRVTTPSLSLAPLRERALVLLLACVVLIVTVNTLIYATLALEYLYGESVLAAAIYLVPAQVAAIIGAKMLAAVLMRRWGTARAGTVVILGLAISLFTLVLMRPDSPIGQLVASAALFSLFGFASITIANAAVMAEARPGEAGAVSAYRGAASAVGSALSIVFLGGIIGLVVRTAYLEPAGQLPDPQSLAEGLQTHGVVGIIVALAAAALFAGAMRLSASTKTR